MDPRLDDLYLRYLAAQLAADRARAIALVVDEGVGGGIPVADLEIDVIARAQREIGRLWEANDISVAQEHAATAISQLALAQLYRHLPQGAPIGRTVLVACVEGELHDMGARLVTDFFEMEGFTVRFLGADVPTDTLVDVVAREKPDLVALALTTNARLPDLARSIERIRARCGDVPIVVGGLDVDPAALAAANVHHHGGSAREIRRTTAQIFGDAA